MKRIVAAIVLAVAVLAIAAFVVSSRVEAGPGCKSCPQPPEGCTFLGCDSQGNCRYQC